MIELSYWWTFSDEEDAPIPSIRDLWVTSWWPTQVRNFMDETVDEAGNPLTSWIPMSMDQAALFEVAVNACIERTNRENDGS